VAMRAIDVIDDERLADNAYKLGNIMRNALRTMDQSLITTVRGKGLLNAIVVKPRNGKDAWDFCVQLMNNGLLAKPTHGDKIRFAPPLVMTEEQMYECIGIIDKTVREF
jgi:ornithine--oxo-acid transaminase